MKNEPNPLAALHKKIIQCKACPRLREHCTEIARVKRKQFAEQDYWGKPVPGFGQENARLWIIGLAPAAHGANRTGRMFTGDQSGLWLYRALHRAGFANQAHSTGRDDGLLLHNAYVSAVARCAPPDNRPTPNEMAHCQSFLEAELHALKDAKVFLVLGQVALRGLWATLPGEVRGGVRAVPRFKHGLEISLSRGRTLLCSYHPSQQNTFTKRLTEPMFDQIFDRANELLDP